MHEPTRALALVHLAPKLAGKAVWISIGNNDHRVSTDDAVAFTRGVVAASVAAQKGQPSAVPVELHVGASLGHTDLAGSHECAAGWLLRQLQVAPAP